MDEKDLQNILEIFAHKIRNPLHAAMINLDVVKVKCEKIAADKSISKHLQIAGNEIQNIHHLTERLIEYVKLPAGKRKKIDLKKFLSK